MAVKEMSPNFKNCVLPICRGASRLSQISKVDILINVANYRTTPNIFAKRDA